METGGMTAVGVTAKTTARSMAVFIDADNLNDPTALDHVMVSIRSFADRVLYRRAVESGSKLATVKQILAVLPELKSKDAMHLSQATKRLRDANVLGKKKSSPSLFGAYPAQFELLPLQQPNSVRFRG